MTPNKEIQIREKTLSSGTIAVRYGLLTSFALMFVTTITYLYALNYGHGFYVTGQFLILLAIPTLFYFLTAYKQKKALGSQAHLKEIFKSVFIVIIISVIVTTLYEQLYFQSIDPDFFIRLRTSLDHTLHNRGASEQVIKEKLSIIDTAIKNKPSGTDLLFAICQSIVLRSILGLFISFVTQRLSIFKSQTT